MERSYGQVLSELRSSLEMSQRKLAADLKISQALLSHYENGTREPGLPFVCKVCDYFGVSADFVLGRILSDEETKTGPCVHYRELNHALIKADREDVREAASEYLEAAANRLTAHLTAEDNGLFIARQSALMAEAELKIVLAVTDNSDYHTK